MPPLKPAEEYVLSLLAAANGNTPPPKIPKDEELIAAVFRELRAQTVLLAPLNVMDKIGLTDAELDDYNDVARLLIAHWHNYMRKAAEITDALEASGIKVATLKGAAAAMNYPTPELRAMGDIDLIVPPAQFQQAADVLLADGWVIHEEPGEGEQSNAHGKLSKSERHLARSKRLSRDEQRPLNKRQHHATNVRQQNQTASTPLAADMRHIGFVKRDYPEIELHRHFSSDGKNSQDTKLDARVFAALDAIEHAEVGPYSVPVLPPLENGLVLLAHLNHHMSTGVGLRQVLDWQMYVEQYLDDALWESSFHQAATEIGMKKLAIYATALCKKYLGLKRTASWFSESAVDSGLIDELATYIMSQGNMGRKHPEDSQKTKRVMRELRSPVSAIRYLTTAGRTHWAPAQKHRALAPLAACYQLARITHLGLARKASLKTLRSEAKEAKRNSALLARLEVK